MMGGWGKEGAAGGGGGKERGSGREEEREREMFIVRERKGCVEKCFPASFQDDNWCTLARLGVISQKHILTAALIFFSFHLTLTCKWTYMPVYCTHGNCMLTYNRLSVYRPTPNNGCTQIWLIQTIETLRNILSFNCNSATFCRR